MLDISIPSAVLGTVFSVIVSRSGKEDVEFSGRGAVAGSTGVCVVDACRIAGIEIIAVGVDLVHGCGVCAKEPIRGDVLRRRGRGV